MPITKNDVLAVLADPVLKTMKFSVGEITVSAEEYQNVADYIASNDIHVVAGKHTADEAVYDRTSNELEAQAADPPLDIDQRMLVLHECTHAISDIEGYNPLTLADEVAAYLAEFTYYKLSKPAPFPKRGNQRHLSPTQTLVFEMYDVVRKYNLHTAKGFGARIAQKDILKLSRVVQLLPRYSGLKLTMRSTNAGVFSFDFIRTIVIAIKYPKPSNSLPSIPALKKNGRP